MEGWVFGACVPTNASLDMTMFSSDAHALLMFEHINGNHMTKTIPPTERGGEDARLHVYDAPGGSC